MIGALTLCLAMAAPSSGDRYAVVIGNNQGQHDEPMLRYAEEDAARVADVLIELGGFPAENVTTVRGGDADSVRQAIIAMNERLREASVNADSQPVAFVFYSGHADANALHLGRTLLDAREVERLVRGSAATFRLLVIDACRSGGITRVKGGRPAALFDIAIERSDQSEGMVILTSAAAGEDAQESDDIKGSFFTHHLVSALRGAADEDMDGRVVLEEAYRYTYNETLRASNRTLAGVQHPTYSYDVRGRGGLVLTTLVSPSHGALALPSGVGFLVLRGGTSGQVIAEVPRSSIARVLALRPGSYALVGRSEDALLEGEVVVFPHAKTHVDILSLRRTEYARLVRKGGADRLVAHGPEIGYWVRTPLAAGADVCQGAAVSYAVDFRYVSVVPTVRACRGSYQNEFVIATTDEGDAELRLQYVVDLPVLSVDVSATGGGGLLSQRFETPGLARPRLASVGILAVGVGVALELPFGFAVRTELAGRSYFFARDRSGDVEPESIMTASLLTGITKRF